QAEDGIRADLVTGVQTCALPISGREPQTPGARPAPYRLHPPPERCAAKPDHADHTRAASCGTCSVPRDGTAAHQGYQTAPLLKRSEERRVGKECGCGVPLSP